MSINQPALNRARASARLNIVRASFSFSFFCLTLFLAGLGCGSGGGGSGGGPLPPLPTVGPLASVVVNNGSSGAQQPGTLYVPKGMITIDARYRLVTHGRDSNGNLIVSLSGHTVAWQFADTSIATFVNGTGGLDKESIQVQTLKDYFDNGSTAEPTTTVTVTVDNDPNLSATVTVVGIVNVEGRWKATGGDSLDDWVTQTGKSFVWGGSRNGTIQGDALSFSTTAGSYTATVTSDRLQWTNGSGPFGVWQAVKMQ